MKALITGGAGMVGSHIVDLLLYNGWDVTILDNLDPLVHPNGVPEWTQSAVRDGAEFVQRDVRDTLDVRLAMKGVDIVFHQAAFGGFTNQLRKYSDVNVGGTATILEEARRAGVKKVVIASSQAVYGIGYVHCADHGYSVAYRIPERLEAGRWEHICPECGGPTTTPLLDETQYLRPWSPYALSKYHAERLALGLGDDWGLPVTALRYALTFGPRQSVSNPYTGICSIFATRVRNGMQPVLYEDGEQLRDFTYVADVAAANLLCAVTPETNGEVYNVGTGVGTRVIAFASAIRHFIREGTPSDLSALVTLPAIPGRYRTHDIRHIVADSTKLRNVGWKPETTMIDGVKHYVRWLLDQPVPPEVFAAGEAVLTNDGIVRTVPS